MEKPHVGLLGFRESLFSFKMNINFFFKTMAMSVSQLLFLLDIKNIFVYVFFKLCVCETTVSEHYIIDATFPLVIPVEVSGLMVKMARMSNKLLWFDCQCK